MRSVPLPFLSKITLLWTRAREPGPVSPVKVDSPLPFPWTQRGEIYSQKYSDIEVLNMCYLGSTEEIVYGRLLERLKAANLVVGTQQISMLPVEPEEFRDL